MQKNKSSKMKVAVTRHRGKGAVCTGLFFYNNKEVFIVYIFLFYLLENRRYKNPKGKAKFKKNC